MKSDSNQLLTKGVVEVIEETHLQKMLAGGKKLRVKFGIDPTSPDLHLGHVVPLRKLRQFQDAGHKIVLIIGDFTARIGDPTGRSEERKPLSEKEVKANMKKYLAEAGKVLNVKKAEVHYNGKWLNKNLATVIELSRAGSISQVLHRADFKKRLDEGHDITLLEAMYPLFQGYDSVAVKADLEIGGTDQKFNLLMGRRVQRYFGTPEQDVMILPLLEGTDGVRKMSKSFGNYIGISEAPEIMFGKIMSVPDDVIPKYILLLTDLPVTEMEKKLAGDPRGVKLELAQAIVGMFHGLKVAKQAQAEFIRVVSNKGMPSEMPVSAVRSQRLPIIDLLLEARLVSSKSEARRLIMQGGVKINGEKQSDDKQVIVIGKGIIVQVGKMKYCKVVHR